MKSLDPKALAEPAAGVLLVDVRRDTEFDSGHIPGSVSNPIGTRRFGDGLRWLADRGEPLVLVGDDDAELRRAADVAAAMGIELYGHLEGGIRRWVAEARPLDSINRMTVPELHDAWSRPARLRVLDVRSPEEAVAGRIPGSVLVPFQQIESIPDVLNADEPVAVICANGARAAVATSWLKRLGARDPIHVVDGGVGQWAAAGWPVETGDSSDAVAP